MDSGSGLEAEAKGSKQGSGEERQADAEGGKQGSREGQEGSTSLTTPGNVEQGRDQKTVGDVGDTTVSLQGFTGNRNWLFVGLQSWSAAPLCVHKCDNIRGFTRLLAALYTSNAFWCLIVRMCVTVRSMQHMASCHSNLNIGSELHEVPEIRNHKLVI